uniref:Uncharacterized protein n=1 Tax=Glossina brevipalpis TaxID=37001 RepID=A0A1A9WZV6_9MUSC
MLEYKMKNKPVKFSLGIVGDLLFSAWYSKQQVQQRNKKVLQKRSTELENFHLEYENNNFPIVPYVTVRESLHTCLSVEFCGVFIINVAGITFHLYLCWINGNEWKEQENGKHRKL